jgi:ABC-type transport system involved in cytochrome c biogenesis permease subunit
MMNERPRIPRPPLSPASRLFATMIVLMFVAAFALVMTGAGAGIVWLVRWMMAAECG